MSTLREPGRVEGKKTMGYELAEQFGWTLPDWIIYPTGGGTGIIGMWKAFEEMEAIGWLSPGPRPKMVTVQTEGCAPIVRAFHEGTPKAAHWENPHTVADGLRVPKAIGDFIMLQNIRESGGTGVAVSDAQMIEDMFAIGKLEGVSAAPEGATTLSAVRKLVADGSIKPHDTVVLFNTGGALKYLDFVTCRGARPVPRPKVDDTRPRTKRRALGPSATDRCRAAPSSFDRRYPPAESATMSGGLFATIFPNTPRRTSSTALPPNRVASTRSNEVGAPPRWRWPRTT